MNNPSRKAKTEKSELPNWVEIQNTKNRNTTTLHNKSYQNKTKNVAIKIKSCLQRKLHNHSLEQRLENCHGGNRKIEQIIAKHLNGQNH